VTVVHADRSPATHALRADQEAAVAALPDASLHLWYEAGATDATDATDGTTAANGPAGVRTGLVDLAEVRVAPGTHAYLCGPLPFMRAVRTQLLAKGVPASHVHYEVFGPDLWFGQD
jgi:nitric oxide dioxygenase